MNDSGHKDGTAPKPTFRKYLITGLLTIIPLWITWLTLKFLFELITEAGRPIVEWVSARLEPVTPSLVYVMTRPVAQKLIVLVCVIVFLYLLGWFATKLVGRRAIDYFGSLLEKIPLVKTVYGGSKRLLDTFQTKPEEIQRVVLINYPSPEMKTVGLLTRTLKDKNTGRKLAAVYVPTTPNPTSGFLEVVPMEDIIPTDWTLNEAMSFIISGGSVGPDAVAYERVPGDESISEPEERP